MSGYEYERYCAKYLKKKGFYDLHVTSGSKDQGIDIIARKNGKKYGIQCKHYARAVGNKAVQQAYAGARYHDCDVAMVITNSSYTKGALDLAESTGVILWGDIGPDPGKRRKKTDPWFSLFLFQCVCFCFMMLGIFDLVSAMILWNMRPNYSMCIGRACAVFLSGYWGIGGKRVGFVFSMLSYIAVAITNLYIYDTGGISAYTLGYFILGLCAPLYVMQIGNLFQKKGRFS